MISIQKNTYFLPNLLNLLLKLKPMRNNSEHIDSCSSFHTESDGFSEGDSDNESKNEDYDVTNNKIIITVFRLILVFFRLQFLVKLSEGFKINLNKNTLSFESIQN